MLTKLIEALPPELRSSVEHNVKTIGNKNLKLAVDIRGPYAREVAQRWQE